MTILCPNGHNNPDLNRFCQTCGHQIIAPVANSMAAGVLLGDRYRIKSEVGRGGFGCTYLCEDINRFNELCILKEFAPQVHGTALLTKAQELFEREAGVMYQLQHPQIPMFREMFRVNRGGVGQLFLVQDYVDGVTYQRLLQQKLQQGQRFTEAEITDFLTQILPVLDYIHGLGVIHRDISPDNLIKRDRDGLPVLIDFGGVKQVAVNATTQCLPASVGNPVIPTRLGKIGYAPNEQMQRGVVFPHSDLYALAATTLVLLTGKEPPNLIDPQNFTWNWREDISLSPTLDGILDRMLQLRPKDRFESAQAVLTALKSGNSIDVSSNPPAILTAPLQTPEIDESKSQVGTVVATPHQQKSAPQTVATPTEPKLLDMFGKTWIAIAAMIGAIGLGWGVASLTAKRSPSVQSPTTTNSPESVPSQSNRPRSIDPNSSEITPIDKISPTLPAALASKGVDARAYGDAVKQVFISQNPNLKVVNGDNQVQSQIDAIAIKLGDKLNNQLSNEAIQGIGKYQPTDRSTWRSQVQKLHLSERALIDLTDAKYRTITNVSAQKLGMKLNRFLKTSIGQVYLATMFDRVQAIKSRQALDEIVFPIGSSSGTVKGTLLPGSGKAYIASLVRGQDIGVNITANEPTNLSIYPPTSRLPAILIASSNHNWDGKTRTNGYYEFVLVSNSDRPIKYELKLTAADLKPTVGGASPLENRPQAPSSNPDRESLW
jgi:serine/threonine protein kinase, bacterial